LKKKVRTLRARRIAHGYGSKEGIGNCKRRAGRSLTAATSAGLFNPMSKRGKKKGHALTKRVKLQATSEKVAPL